MGGLIRGPAGAAWIDGGLSKYYSADGVIRWCCFFWNCPRRGGCECASSKTEVRFRQSTVLHDFVAGYGAGGADEGASGPQFMTEIHAHANGEFGTDARRARVGAASDIVGRRGHETFYETGRRCRVCAAGAGGSAGSARFQFRRRDRGRGERCIPVARGLEIQFAEAIPGQWCAPEID